MGHNNDDALEDLARLESAREIHDEVEGTDLRVDILVNNAAAGVMPGRFDETNLEDIDDQIQINVVTLTHLTRLFSAPMVERGAGRILNVSSAAGEFPDSAFGVYTATKGYVSTLSNVLAEQLEPVGITVTVLVPGWTDTDMAWEAFRALDIDPEPREVLSPEEVAKAGYNGLLSGQTRIIPGQTYREALKNAFTTRASNIDP